MRGSHVRRNRLRIDTFDHFPGFRGLPGADHQAGRVDHPNAITFQETLGAHAADWGEGGLVIDLAGLEFVTSAGLRALLVTHRAISSSGGRMVVTGLKGIVREVFRISKFDALLNVAESVGEGVARVSADAHQEYSD